MRPLDPRVQLWRKSSFSAANGDCVEVGHRPDGRIGVRDSKKMSNSSIGFTPAQWRDFIVGVKIDFASRDNLTNYSPSLAETCQGE